MQLICFADLEFDYINPYESVLRINTVILPEYITHGVLCLLYLVKLTLTCEKSEGPRHP
ncbi:hypothetical protein Hdeb2414_s0018g00532101 [Helianthus debilis subsp. tardiflorus]